VFAGLALAALGTVGSAGGILEGTAHAEGSPAAEQFFLDGRAAMKRGEFEKARAMFAESQRLDPAPGTLVNLALAEEKLGKLSLAWEHARAALEGLPESDDRHGVARALRDAIEPRLARLTLRAEKALPAGTKITVDDVELSVASLGVALPEDPGEHRVVIKSPGHKDLAVTVNLAERGKETYTVQLGELSSEKVMPNPPEGASGQSRDTETSPLRTVGFITAGVGVAGVAVGSVFGVLTLGKKSDVEAHCKPNCDGTGTDAQSAGKTFSTVSTVSFIAGGVLLAGGITLIVISPKAEKRSAFMDSATVRATPGGLVLGGTF
jgi:hypothetical protein